MIDLEKLKQNFGGEIDASEETRKTFSRDASIFEITPEVVVSPRDVADVRNLVQFASTEKKAGHYIGLTPRAGGTDMTGAAISNSVIVDFTKYLNRVGEVEHKTIHAQPGAYYRDFEKVTLAGNLIMPSYPASKSICGIGGMVGNNAGGEKSLSYGQVRDYVQALKVVLADGNEYSVKPLTAEELEQKIHQDDFEGSVYKKIFLILKENESKINAAKPSTSKNSSGYYLWDVWDGKTFDLTKLFVGSQGTLGIVTDVTFKLVPVKPASTLLVMFLKDLNEIGDIINHVKNYKPESFELYDDHTLRLALRFLPDIAKKMGVGTLKLLWQFLPEMFMALRGGLPKIVLLAEFTGNTEAETRRQAELVEEDVKATFHVPTHKTKNQLEANKYWTVRRESFNLLRQHAQGKVPSPFVEDIIVHPEQLSEFLPRLRAIFTKYPSFVYAIAGHAGDANFHIIPFINITSPREREMVIRLSSEVYKLTLALKGSISAEHNDGLVRGPFLEQMFGTEMLELFRQVKKIFDPLDIFNPGRKVEATMADFEKYMRRT